MSKIIKRIDNIKIFNSHFYNDRRGFFFEIYNKKRFFLLNIKDSFIQNSISVSKKGVIRGLHYTINNPQSQLLTVLEGKIFDCLVDLRVNSKNFLKYYSFILKHNKNNQIYMPPGFAHGFCVLSNKAILHYSASKTYEPSNSGGLIWNDKKINIKWPQKKPIISKRDKNFKTIDNLIKSKKLPKI